MAGSDDRENGIDDNEIGTVLASEGVEYLISGAGKVPFSSCDGKMVCLFFSANWSRSCKKFILRLVELYEDLRNMGKKFEIILISLDRDEKGFREQFKCMPWLAVPFDISLHKRLSKRYHVDAIPSVIPMFLDGSLMDGNSVELIEDYGVRAFPFTKVRREELKAIDDSKCEGGDLEELLAHQGRSYVISKYGQQMAVSKLVGKTVGLYFGAHWCPPCQSFSTKLIEAYNEVKSTGQKFEIVFVSTDRNHEEFEVNLSNMPWYAIPYEDKTSQDLYRIFNVKGIPTLVLIGPDGKTISRDGRAMISLYGSLAFPFTASRIGEIEVTLKKERDRLPDQVRDTKHEHVLKLDRAKAFICDSCKKQGRFWAFSCDTCDYDLHPTCLEETSYKNQ